MFRLFLGSTEDKKVEEQKQELTATQSRQKNVQEKHRQIKAMLDAQQAEIEALKKKKAPESSSVSLSVPTKKEVDKAKLAADKAAKKLKENQKREELLNGYKEQKDKNKKNLHKVELNEAGERIPTMGYQPTELQRKIAGLTNRVPTKKHESQYNAFGERIPNSYNQLTEVDNSMPDRFNNYYVSPRSEKEKYSGLSLQWINKSDEQKRDNKIASNKARVEAQAAAKEAEIKAKTSCSSSSSSWASRISRGTQM